MDEDRAVAGFPPQARVTRCADILAADVAGEVVLLNVESGYFHQLNVMGSYIWNLLEHPMILSALCTRMLDEFAVDVDTCWREVIGFLQDMQANGIIVVDAGPAS